MKLKTPGSDLLSVSLSTTCLQFHQHLVSAAKQVDHLPVIAVLQPLVVIQQLYDAAFTPISSASNLSPSSPFASQPPFFHSYSLSRMYPPYLLTCLGKPKAATNAWMWFDSYCSSAILVFSLIQPGRKRWSQLHVKWLPGWSS